MVHSVPGPIPIPALACSYTTGLDLPSGHSDGYGLQSSPAPSGICPAPNSGILVQYAGEPANKQEGRVVGFLIEIFWALLMVGVPIGIFTLALVWWALQGGHFKESSDVEALKREIKAMSQRRKKGSKKKTRAEKKEESRQLHPLQRKWAKFGGGFYGIVAFFTYIVVEVLEIISTISNFGGFFDFLKQLNFNVLVQMFVQALMNFITAMVWPAYWIKRIDTDQVWIWFVMAYAGYWVGLKLAQILIQRRSQVVT